VDEPKLQDGALRALETTCFPSELSSGEGSMNPCLAACGFSFPSRLPAKLQAGADFLAELGCCPTPDGWVWEPGPTCRGVPVLGMWILGVDFSPIFACLGPKENYGEDLAMSPSSGL